MIAIPVSFILGIALGWSLCKWRHYEHDELVKSIAQDIRDGKALGYEFVLKGEKK